MDLKNKKILVTGGAGFLGHHVVRKLLERGVPEENIFAPRSRELDLRDRSNCDKVVSGRDIVVHLAGIGGDVEFHRAHPAKIFYDNLVMGVELMEAARIAGAEKFMSVGSAAEYPDNAPLPLNEQNFWLGPPDPLHASYIVAKKMLLVQSQAYRKQYGFNAINLILSNVYGPGESENGGPISALMRRIGEAERKNERTVEAWGTGRPTRDFLYVEDAAEGIVLALGLYNEAELLNIGSGQEISIKELVELIAKLAHFTGTIKFDASRPDGQMRRMLDTGLAEREINFKAKTDLEAGLRETIKYHGYQK